MDIPYKYSEYTERVVHLFALQYHEPCKCSISGLPDTFDASLKGRGDVFKSTRPSVADAMLSDAFRNTRNARIVNVIRGQNAPFIRQLVGRSSRAFAPLVLLLPFPAREGRKTLLEHKFAGVDTITLKYYGNEKLSPTRAMFASFSAKDNATTRPDLRDVVL